MAEDGTIYTISYNFLVRDLPPGLEHLPTPCLTDSLEVISPEGKQIKRIPLLEAFKDSPFAPLLSVLEKPSLFDDLIAADAPMPAAQQDMRRRDVIHTNAVKVLSRKLAPKFPMFKAGQLMISPRHLDTIAMLDPDSGKVTWAARGPWHAQHDPSFLDNGHLLLFDNLGSVKSSRVLEYDPQNQSFPWWYPDDYGTRFLHTHPGVTQRLPNGNTLIVEFRKWPSIRSDAGPRNCLVMLPRPSDGDLRSPLFGGGAAFPEKGSASTLNTAAASGNFLRLLLILTRMKEATLEADVMKSD